jgi:hypothetical protein
LQVVNGMPVHIINPKKGRRGIVVVQTVLFVCALLCPVQSDFVCGQPQTKLKTSERLRFQVTDSKTDVPVPGAAVSLVYWQKNTTTKDKKEIEGKTDTNGLADFLRVEADKMAVSVTAKGYRSCWRWIHPNESVEPIHIRLEKWVHQTK